MQAGAIQVQGTINGYGERCGNANLCSIIPNLELKLGLSALPDGQLARLAEISRFVTEVANLSPDDHLPYVGKSAFAHKGGLHVSGMRRSQMSYQHIDPVIVGNQARVWSFRSFPDAATCSAKPRNTASSWVEGENVASVSE